MDIKLSDRIEDVVQAMEEADCLHAEEEVEAAIDRMAAEITGRLSGRNPVVVCLMNGGVIVTGKLLPKLRFPLEVDYVHATRYGDSLSGGGLDWVVPVSREVRGRTILLVDDILDVGTTLTAVAEFFVSAGAAEILSAVLVDKNHDRKARPGLKADFTGLEAEDRFLFGYGMDYKGYWRNAPGIFAVKGT